MASYDRDQFAFTKGMNAYSKATLSIRRDSWFAPVRRLLEPGLIAVFICVSAIAGARANETGSRLIPVSRSLEIADGADYKKLYERKLFVNKADLARFTYLPGLNDTERTAAVYQSPGKANSLPDSYWVTTTEASGQLLSCIPIPGQQERSVDARSISVRRDDAPLPASTAKALHDVWLGMLSRAQPLHQKIIRGDSPTFLFSAIDRRGILLRAQADTVKGNTKDLWRIGESLIEYCRAPASKRPELVLKLESESSRLLKRVNQTR